jgi:hypothetical protein
MGFVNFIKRTAKKIGGGIAMGGKWLGEHAKPIIHGIANVVEKAAPNAAAAASALGQPELAGPISLAGKFAGNVRQATDKEKIPAPMYRLQEPKPPK